MTKNQQPIEKATNDLDVDLHSIFKTVQGEGPFSGFPAVFVRLAGCNLQCPFCDTEYTLGRQKVRPAEVAWQVKTKAGSARLVVITGGEPFRQPEALKLLCDELLAAGFFVQIETNGTLPPPDGLPYRLRLEGSNQQGIYVVVSPKAGRVAEATAKRAICYKYVLSHDSIDEDDGLPVQVLGHSVKSRVARPWPIVHAIPIYVQPCDHGEDEPEANRLSLQAAAESAMRYNYILQLQIHKLAGLE